MTTKEDVAYHRSNGSWRTLEQKAQELIEDTRRAGGESFEAVLGGGTRLMLALNHRISDDIDLFVDSSGWLPYVSPRLNDRFDGELKDYEEDSSFVKLNFPEGQIDFIASSSLLSMNADIWNPPAIETNLPLMSPAEILAKKLFFRGWALQARDLFDWVAMKFHAPKDTISDEIFANLLSEKMDKIKEAISHMASRESQKKSWDNIKSPWKLDFFESIQWAKTQLDTWSEISQSERKQQSQFRPKN